MSVPTREPGPVEPRLRVYRRGAGSRILHRPAGGSRSRAAALGIHALTAAVAERSGSAGAHLPEGGSGTVPHVRCRAAVHLPGAAVAPTTAPDEGPICPLMDFGTSDNGT